MLTVSATEATFMGLAFALIGALIAACATVYAARLTAQRQQLYVESAKFRSEYVEEIIKLRSAHEDVFRILTDDVMARHRKAKVLFEPWIPRCRVKRFNEAWSAYEGTIKTRAPGSLDNRAKECEGALNRIESILSFATHRG